VNANRILVERLAEQLSRHNARVTVAESCTGGWLAKYLTDVPGSSAWFEYGFISYGDNAKADLLNVAPELLEQHGAVSQEVAEAKVSGALDRSGADIAVAITGIAGPAGGSPDKPVGTVWFGGLVGGAAPTSECHYFEGDRDTVRRQAVSTALRLLLDASEQLN
jgi:nicotinamide-nucleotide amidase